MLEYLQENTTKMVNINVFFFQLPVFSLVPVINDSDFAGYFKQPSFPTVSLRNLNSYSLKKSESGTSLNIIDIAYQSRSNHIHCNYDNSREAQGWIDIFLNHIIRILKIGI